MIKEIQLELSPREAYYSENLLSVVAREADIEPERLTGMQILKRSLDARQRNIKVLLRCRLFIDEHVEEDSYPFEYHYIGKKQAVIIVGAGPAGLFSALRLIQLGYKPIILERGYDVSARKTHIATMYREGRINPESNYAFGEGGAGTFSDGKLYTRSKKRGDVERILQILRFHGAGPEILYDAHPHIGTDKLSAIIKRIRKTILDCGGEICFGKKVTDILTNERTVKGVACEDGTVYESGRVILATGHSARDIYELLWKKQIHIVAKPFALGVRVEHPQELIDEIQYHNSRQIPFLPAATYALTAQIQGRGVYSFCMCPGGFMVPAATADNEMVVNGMSPSHRGSPFANSGIVVEVRSSDFQPFVEKGPLAGLAFQQWLETIARNNSAGKLVAPAQRLTDFVKGRLSPTLPPVSYIPGVVSSPIHFWLPEPLSGCLREAFRHFSNKMKGFLTEEAAVVALESRTSSPVQIPRDADTLQHPELRGLFPCGEGAGYAGGIVSAAMDGERCAEAACL